MGCLAALSTGQQITLNIHYMSHIIKDRLNALRKLMEARGIEAFIIPSTDPHQSEYVAPHWQSRQWISGFTGSAGTVVVLQKEAGLWTDSRYFLQAEAELEGSGIDLYKMGIGGTDSIADYLTGRLDGGEQVGIDGSLFSANEVKALKKELDISGIKIVDVGDLMEEIWKDRPPMPGGQVCIHDVKYAGRTIGQKLEEIRGKMAHDDIETVLLSALDEIAWALNLRGNDVPCNPMFVSYLAIGHIRAYLFIEPGKVPAEVRAYLEEAGVELRPYDAVRKFLSSPEADGVATDSSKTSYALSGLPKRREEYASPVALMKAVRNEVEIQGIHEAMVRDGVALVRFLRWLEEAVPRGGETELSVSRKLHDLRAAQPLYRGESFDTIAGYAEHGAIVHYEATPETDAPLAPRGFLLLDSGAQYLDGTTDITRTVALGGLTAEEKRDYTLVLKGHIALAQAVFPEGTRGVQLDVLARMPLWQNRLNYLHGTGHGVGHFLNVHEGPQSIRMNENPVTLQAGMVTSNEPGVYKAGKHGVRIENLVLTVPAGEGMFGGYLRFETLTLCPICTKGIVKELLSPAEVEWLNSYHRMVFERLSPHLEEADYRWLWNACMKI